MVHQASPVHLFWAPLPSTALQCPAPSKHSPFFVCLFEMGDLAMELRLALTSRVSCLNLPSARITSMQHHFYQQGLVTLCSNLDSLTSPSCCLVQSSREGMLSLGGDTASDLGGYTPDVLPVVADNAVVIAAPAPIQCSTLHREEQLLIRACHRHWSLVGL